MWEAHVAQHAHARPFADGPHGAGEIAQAVGRKHRGLLEWRNVIRARQVRGVVLDAVKLRANAFRGDPERAGDVLAHSGETLHHAQTVQRKSRHAGSEAQLGAKPRPRVARNGDVVDLGKLCARSVQAELHGARRQARRVFHAIEPLFLHGRNQPPVNDNRRRGVGVICVDRQE